MRQHTDASTAFLFPASRMLVESRDGSGANGSGGRPAAVPCSVLQALRNTAVSIEPASPPDRPLSVVGAGFVWLGITIANCYLLVNSKMRYL